MRKFLLLLITAGLALASCSGGKFALAPERVHVIPPKVLKKKAQGKEKKIEVTKQTQQKKTAVVYSSSGKEIDIVYGGARSYRGKVYKLSVAYDNIPTYDFIINVLKNTLHKNVVIETKISGNITVILDGSFYEDELLNIVKQILNNQGLTVIRQGKSIIVKRARSYPRFSLSREAAFWIYKPKYIGAASAYQVAFELLSQEGRAKIVERNILLIIDKRHNVISIRRLIKLIDTETMAGNNIKIFKLNNSEPSDVSKNITQILRAMKISPMNYSLIPIDRLSFLVAVTSSLELMNRVTDLVKIMDSAQNKEKKNIYIYKVQYVKVDKLAKILKELLSGRGAIEAKPKKGQKTKTPVIVTSNVVIVPDEVNNALIIQATQEDYDRIKPIIASVDVMPRQVLIEVLIAEITLDKQFENGIEWWLKVKGNKYTAQATVSYGLAGSREKLFGLTYYGINPDNYWNFLYFLATKTNLTVLSSPHILVRDNQEASIEVGKEVPILTTETVGSIQIQGTAAIDRRIEYRDVGIILRVKPHISEEGFVTLEISQESSSAEKNTVSGIDSPVILTRKIKTTLMVQDEHTIILGGIIDRRNNTVKKKVPLLGDIPLLGKLFSYESTERSRTELIVMITPHVITSVKQADIISSMFEQKLKKLIKKQHESK